MPERLPLIPADEFMRMPKGAFNAFIEGSWYRGYSPMLSDRKRIAIEPLPYPEDRITKFFAEKYKVSREEASQIIKREGLQYDYEFIMKNKLADLWIDLKEFSYYKNYVLPARKKSEEENLLSLILTGNKQLPEIDIEKVKAYEGQFYNGVPIIEVQNSIYYILRPVYEKTYGKPDNSIVVERNGTLYVMAKPKEKEEEVPVES